MSSQQMMLKKMLKKHQLWKVKMQWLLKWMVLKMIQLMKMN